MSMVLIFLIHLYQRFLSRHFADACLYVPSCSNYSIQAIQKYGAWRGLRLSIDRLSRCRPPYEGGEDPVT